MFAVDADADADAADKALLVGARFIQGYRKTPGVPLTLSAAIGLRKGRC